MPIHDLGYRGWQGKKSSRVTRWWVIASAGISIVWRNMWLRRMMMIAWLPATYVGLGFFAFEYYVERSNVTGPRQEFLEGDNGSPLDRRFERRFQRRFERQIEDRIEAVFFLQMLRRISDGEMVREQLANADDPQQLRHLVWAWLLMVFFRYPQGLLMLLVVGMIAPPLIAKDVRSKGFLLYFSRPVNPLEYLLAKATIVWCYLALMTTLPALALYIVGVLLSPSLSVALDTWDLPLRILAASVVLMVPTTGLALLFSSLTSESRFAGFAWFTVWSLGWIAYFSVQTTRSQELDPRWTAVSLYHTLGNVQRWIFGMDTTLDAIWYSLAILIGLTIFSLVVLVRRVSAPIRV